MESDSTAKPQKSRPSVKDFVKNQRNAITASDGIGIPVEEDLNIEIFTFGAPTIKYHTLIPSKYIEVLVADTQTFHLPIELTYFSPWITRLLNDKSGTFKETTTSSLTFPEFGVEAMEYVFRWLATEASLNGIPNPSVNNAEQSNRDRISFQFHLPGELVMDILNIAYFLEIDGLINLCSSMLAFYLEDIPSFESIPHQLLSKILARVSPEVMLRLEAKNEFENMLVETTNYWEQAFAKRDWNPYEPRYFCSWSKLIDLSNGYAFNISEEPNNNNNSNTATTSLAAKYASRLIQEKSTTAVTEDAQNEFLNLISSLENNNSGSISKLITQHTIRWLAIPLEQFLSRFNSLEFLEISGVALEEEDLAYLGKYLATHPQCTQLRLENCALESEPLLKSGILGATLSCLDLTNNALGITNPVLLNKCFASMTKLTRLSLSNNKFASDGVNSILSSIANPEQLEVLDLSENKIKSPELDWSIMLQFSNLRYLVLSENGFLLKQKWSYDASAIRNIRLPSSLIALDVSYCGLKDSDTDHMLDYLIQNKIPVHTLNLACNDLTNSIAFKIASIINGNLLPWQNLDVSNNLFDDSCGVAIGNALAENTTLLFLDLSRNNLKEKSGTAIAAGLSKNSTLQTLHINVNFCGQKTLDAITQSNPNLMLHASGVVSTGVQKMWRYRGNPPRIQ